jgi:hypothetical protein
MRSEPQKHLDIEQNLGLMDGRLILVYPAHVAQESIIYSIAILSNNQEILVLVYHYCV